MVTFYKIQHVLLQTEKYAERFSDNTDGGKTELYSKYFDHLNRRRAMKDFARLNIFIADSNVLTTEESADYTLNQLLSDIGGQLGLWIGTSVITLTEVVELLVSN
jgi:hypothetical protein